MSDAERHIIEYENQADLQRLRNLRPIDDEFMRCLFKDNIPLAELVLRIITGKQDFQRAEKGARPQRARYLSSVMDIENLNAGQEFTGLTLIKVQELAALK